MLSWLWLEMPLHFGLCKLELREVNSVLKQISGMCRACAETAADLVAYWKLDHIRFLVVSLGTS